MTPVSAPTWFLEIDGAMRGPFSPEHVRELLRSGQISLSTRATQDRVAGQWLALGQIAEFRRAETPESKDAASNLFDTLIAARERRPANRPTPPPQPVRSSSDDGDEPNLMKTLAFGAVVIMMAAGSWALVSYLKHRPSIRPSVAGDEGLAIQARKTAPRAPIEAEAVAPAAAAGPAQPTRPSMGYRFGGVPGPGRPGGPMARGMPPQMRVGNEPPAVHPPAYADPERRDDEQARPNEDQPQDSDPFTQGPPQGQPQQVGQPAQFNGEAAPPPAGPPQGQPGLQQVDTDPGNPNGAQNGAPPGGLAAPGNPQPAE